MSAATVFSSCWMRTWLSCTCVSSCTRALLSSLSWVLSCSVRVCSASTWLRRSCSCCALARTGAEDELNKEEEVEEFSNGCAGELKPTVEEEDPTPGVDRAPPMALKLLFIKLLLAPVLPGMPVFVRVETMVWSVLTCCSTLRSCGKTELCSCSFWRSSDADSCWSCSPTRDSLCYTNK